MEVVLEVADASDGWGDGAGNTELGITKSLCVRQSGQVLVAFLRESLVDDIQSSSLCEALAEEDRHDRIHSRKDNH